MNNTAFLREARVLQDRNIDPERSPSILSTLSARDPGHGPWCTAATAIASNSISPTETRSSGPEADGSSPRASEPKRPGDDRSTSNGSLPLQDNVPVNGRLTGNRDPAFARKR